MTDIDPTIIPIPTTDVPDTKIGPEIGIDNVDEDADRMDCEAFKGCQDRLWLRTITGMLQGKLLMDPSDHVQKSIDRMLTAAADRASRILRNDITDY